MSAALLEALHSVSPRRPRLAMRIAWVGQLLTAMRRRARARNDLLHADARMLADLGISRAEANFRVLHDRLD
jgi:uncharacterized protein YjiS (DUF1127 family)